MSKRLFGFGLRSAARGAAAALALWVFGATGAGVARAQDAGVRVNGTDVSAGSGDGWSRNGEEVILQRNGMTYVVDGTASGGSVRIVIMGNCTMVASNLALSGGTPVSVYNGYSPVLELAGTNSFSGGGDCAGLGVPEGRSITIRGDGALTATGGYWGAGIGGGAYTNAGSITIEGGTVSAEGGASSAGIGGGYKGHGGTVAISGGTVSATGNSYGAGIGGGYQGKAGDVTISGGTVSATGGSGWGEGGAGIGSGSTAARGGSVVISGGTVTATGGGNSAGIGGGYRTMGFDVSIRGGLVVAKGTGDGAGIGGGGNTTGYGETARISVSGGTVRPAAGGYGWNIGPGSSDSCEYRVTLSGGSVGTVADEIRQAPTNAAGAAVWRVAVSGFAADEPVTGIAGLPAGYGTEGIVADGDGKVYLWLPDGSYRFKAVSDGEVRYVAAVVDGAAVETAAQDGMGLLVNGEDVAMGAGPGWSYDGAHLVVLSGSGPFALTGAASGLCVRVAASCTVAASNLSLDVRGVDGVAALELGSGVSATLALAGTNVLRSGSWAAGVQVGDGRSLRIVDAEGQEPNAGRLEARGGNNAAGIGGGNGQGVGSIALAGGTVAAYGGEFAAGIGSGRNGRGGTVSVEDGAVVEKADGGWWGAGIGGGECSTGPEVVVSGGRILSAGGYYGACIGGGGRGTNAVVRISGGEVAAGLGTGLSCAGIGGGRENVGVVVEISGGTVVAAGLQDAAGIGVAGDSRDCRVSITGGRVWATGGNGGGAGIGGASASTGLEISISGGTVVPAVRGSDPGNLVGFGRSQAYGATCGVAFTGGSVAAGAADVVPAATNRASQTVWPVTVPLPQGTDTNAPVAFRALPAGYGTNDIYPDAQGQVYLWLANGTHLFAAAGTVYRAEVADAGTVAVPWVPGLEVNGVDIVALSGEGWTYDVGSRLELSGPGPFTVSGSISNVGLVAAADCAVTLSNALFDASAANGVSAFALEGGHSVALTLAGTNELRGGANAAGIRVPAADSLSIDGDGALAATGGAYAAGIGGARAETSGSVTVSNGTVSATGGRAAAGIGGGGTPAEHGGSGGSCIIAGGKVTAQGGESGGAGIGGGSYEGTGGTIVISGGEVAATGGRYGAGIGGGHQGAAVSCTILGGTVTAQGGADGGAGIGGGSYGDGGTIVISNGTVTATAGFGAAGLGGGMNRSGVSCTIAGGTVTAQGGGDAAGIGGGNIGAGGTIAISGGLVHATGGNYAPGLGGGSNGKNATVTVTGGTVVPKGGYGAPFDVGLGYNSQYSGGPVSFTGGSVAVASAAVTNAPTGIGGARVWRLEVGGLPAGGKVTGLASLASPSSLSGYGADDIWADAAGKIYLWLPDGLYDFEVAVDGGDAVGYVARVAGADTAANVFVPSGLTVNGRDVAHLVGDGWWCDTKHSVYLTNAPAAGTFSIKGTSTVFGVTAETSCTNVLDGVDISLSADAGRPAFEVGGTNLSVTLVSAADTSNRLATLASGYAAIRAAAANGATLVLDGTGAIGAESETGGAAIGGNREEGAGTIRIVEGTVAAQGGGGAAGIGTGSNGRGGSIEIAGGTVTAKAGSSGTGIGAGKYGGDVAVSIAGGTVAARGSIEYSSGIGMGRYASNVTVAVSGGTVAATGEYYGAGIGGAEGSKGGSVSITGGQITATGGSRGSGIGPAGESGFGTIEIAGGTVTATGNGNALDIGCGYSAFGGQPGKAEKVTLTGGNILAGPSAVVPAPSNAVPEAVWAVDVPLGTWNPDELVAFHHLPDNYGTNDLYPSESGLLRLWLPNGEYAFLANDTPYHATVSDAATTAEVWQTGFTVNGRDVAYFSGPGWNMDWATRRVSLTNEMDYAVAGTSTSFWVLADADCDVTVTDVTIDLTNAQYGPSPFKLDSNRSVTLAIEGTNFFAAAEDGAGVFLSTGEAVTISGGGSLTARGGEYGAGIGSGPYSDSAGDITIAGGTVIAEGGNWSAGIGGGQNGAGGTITITGGNVTATGGEEGAGIGGGQDSAGGTIAISGDATVVTATGGGCAAGIGGGGDNATGTITITGGTVTANGGGGAAGIGGGIGGGSGGIAISAGTVAATGGANGPGIGNGSRGTGGSVTISGGDVTATGGSGGTGAGIGGGSYAPGGSIAVSGGTVVATGTGCGAGIGGGFQGAGGTITITGGTVTAKGGPGESSFGGGAGIGGGYDGDGGTIAISGDATVTATGGQYGAGIGGGKKGDGGMVAIWDGTVTATGGLEGAGIGGGCQGNGGTIAIYYGTVTAKGGDDGAGIGGGTGINGDGAYGNGGNIAISGGTVEATGGKQAAGIGGGYHSSGGTIEISGFATVRATGGLEAAGIGSGRNADDSGAITISGGIVEAVGGGNWGAGIGGGAYSPGKTIKITGGRIRAVGTESGAAIGGGTEAYGGDISISSGTVQVESGSTWTIGNGRDAGLSSYRNIFTGGAIYTTLEKVYRAPFGNDRILIPVYPVELDIGVPTNQVRSLAIYAVDNSAATSEYWSYGQRDMYTDENGKLVIWLPATDGKVLQITVRMTDGTVRYFCITIDEGGEIHVVDHLVVNGTFVLEGRDQGTSNWNYVNDTKLLTLLGSVNVQGVSTNGGHRIAIPAGGASSVTLEALTLAAKNQKYWSAIIVSNTCTVTLASGLRTNWVAARGQYAAGIEVASNAVVTIEGEGPLVGVGGQYGAGIGSRGGNPPCGKIEIRSGNVTGIGGEKAAGIGGGLSGNLQEGSIVVKGGIVAGYGGANAAGIGAGYKPNGTFRVPDGAFRVEGGSVAAYGDKTPAADALSTGTQSWSDFVDSLGNTLTPTDDGAFKATVITGGSVVPSRHRRASPRPVNADGECLYRVLMGGFEPFEEVDVSCEDLPADYSTDGIVADADGLVCIWMVATNHAHVVVANGQYFTSHYPSTNTASLYPHDTDLADGGSDVPPGDLPPSGPDRTNTLHRVTVPLLDPGADVALEIQAYTETLYPKADSEGRYFFYVADGDYTFKANSLDYAVRVEGGPATAIRIDPENPTGVTVDGVDVCTGVGPGWTYEFATSNLVLSAGAPVVTGCNTEGRVQITVAADMTLTAGGLTLKAARNTAPIALAPGVTTTLALAGENTLTGGEHCAAVEVPAGALLEISGDGALDAHGGHTAAAIGGSRWMEPGTVAISGGTVSAWGGWCSAGIGSAYQTSNGTVVVSGGTVTAHGGPGGPGIGCAAENFGNCTVSISGGTVTAIGGDNGAGIGGGLGSEPCGISITGGTVDALGGMDGAGIGGGDRGTAGTVVGTISISDGTVTATGGENGAGIGGGYDSRGGTVSISGGNVTANGGVDGAGIGGGHLASGGTITITGGTVSAHGGSNGAGIGSGMAGNSGTITISGGTVEAVAANGMGGAGIGGGYGVDGGTITISGGTVDAQANSGASIGGGYDKGAGTIVISGGIVNAKCSFSSAAIGGGRNGVGGTVAISGGTVTATGAGSVPDVGSGIDGSVQSVTFTGGSIHAEAAKVSPAAANAAARAVHPVDFRVGAANVKVETFTIVNPPLAYGTNDLYTDANGILRAWLPDGRWFLDLGIEGGATERWAALVDGENTFASRYAPVSTGFSVNGADVGGICGDGWFFDTAEGTVTLSGAGPYVLSGTLSNGTVRAAADCSVALSNAVVDATGAADGTPALQPAAGKTLALSLAGTNSLAGADGGAGLAVPGGTTLEITDGGGTLSATGGAGAAGIGGCADAAAGTIRIAGGTISSTGGANGAGIGGGSYAGSQQCRIEISGGVLTATAGEGAYAVGAGAKDGSFSSDFGHIAITGGTVVTVYQRDLGIGSGRDKLTSNANSVRITGGSVMAALNAVSPVAWGYGHNSACPVDVDVGRAGSPVTADIPIDDGNGGTVGYGMNDVFSDENGIVRFWLPEGNRIVEIDGNGWRLHVSENGSSAERWVSGLAVNGESVSAISGDGWTFDMATMALRLTNSGPFAVSGEEPGASVSVEADCNVTFDGVVLDTGENGLAAVSIASGVTATLELAGTNSLASGQYHPGLDIAETASLVLRGDGFLSATGGEYGAGIGSAWTNSSGNLAIEGGTIVAQGGRAGAGIGGGYANNSGGGCGTIRIFGGDVTATGGGSAPGIGQLGSSDDHPGSILVGGGIVTAQGGDYGAGIGGKNYGGTPVTITGGVVSATGGKYGAGIGGCSGCRADVTISGGIVTATGGYHGAGIGAGEGGYGVTYSTGTVRISGGVVTATGGEGAHGVGGGYLTGDGTVEITGGTVTATGGDGGMDVGIIGPDGIAGSVVFGGGSILAAQAAVKPAPKNAAGAAVWRVDVAVPDPDPARAVTITGLAGYGVDGIYPDANGDIHLWLPDGTYDFEVDGTAVHEEIDGSSIFVPLGVTVDGVDVAHRSGTNWTLDETNRVVITGPCVVAGSNTLDGVSFRLETSAEVVFSNVCVHSELGFKVATNVQASVRGVGRNVVRATYYGHALEEGAGLAVAGGTFEFRIEDSIAILGGSVSGISTYYAAPTNAAGARVYPADLKGFAPGAAVGPLQGLPDYYDTAEIYADDAGEVHLWLPEGTCVATNDADGAKWTIRVGSDGKTTVVAWNDGFTVNGENLAALSGNGWNYANGVLTLSGLDRYTLRGTNTVGDIRVAVASDSTVELAGVSIQSEQPIALESGVTATVVLSGPGNRLVSSNSGNAALWVREDASLTVTNATADARLCAQGGNYGAGIGAGSNWKPGSITIAGGTVEARSGASGQGNGAGIGGGNGGTFGLIRITGGKVFAYGGAESSDRAAAGIGGGVGGWYYGVVGRIEISGGTVYASGGRISDALFAADIGEGLFWSANADINAAVVITGGSVVPAHFDSEKERFTQGLCTVTNMAHDATGRVVHAVTVALGTPGVPVAVDGLPDGYGTNDIYSDDSGTICLWLPDGTYAFTAGGSAWTATIDGADSIAQPVSTDTGVLVDGTDAGDGSGNGWTYDPATSTLAFNASGTYNVSGTGPVRLSAADGVAVTLAPVTNLTLSGASPILTGPGTFAIAGGTFALDGDTAAPLAVTGGSLHLGGTATPPVSNATEAVYCVAITNLAPDAPVAFSGLPAWYGTDSIVADAHGNVFLWLPAGDWSGIVPSTSSRRGDDPSTHVFSANGYEYTVAFEDDAATVASVRELPLENLEILDATLSPDGTSLVLTVVAAPATWTHGFADTLSVLQITDLSSTNSTSFSDSTLSPDGTVTFTVPLGDLTPATFFRVTRRPTTP